jgi:hypothetical protein
MYDVEAIASDDVWAVGALATGNSTAEAVVHHWNGATWSVVPTPSTGTPRSGLVSIDAVSANDIWAVGFVDAGNSTPLIEHWNGSSWSIVASPSPPTTFSNLRAIDAISANDIWAVGTKGSTTSTQVLLMHWDGISWTEYSAPNPGDLNPADLNILIGVSGASSDDVWAVGDARLDGPDPSLLLHWDGAVWTNVPSGQPDFENFSFRDVIAVDTHDVWAVGVQAESPPYPIDADVLIQQCVGPIADQDSDGIPDALDACPTDPEDIDGFEDQDGCPDPDNDGDGILDAVDGCPNDSEDVDGFEDADGCPDVDNDNDGVPDATDGCPNDPEDFDGFEDQDGCPDPDNDGDGIPDEVDVCPLLPGTVQFDGCPPPGTPIAVGGAVGLLATDGDPTSVASDADPSSNVLHAALIGVILAVSAGAAFFLVRKPFG